MTHVNTSLKETGGVRGPVTLSGHNPAGEGRGPVDGLLLICLFCVLAIVVLLGALIAISVRRSRHDRERWAFLLHQAHQQGWIISHHPHVDWTARLPGQNSGGVSVAISGIVDGRPVAAAEYSYTTSSVTMVSNSPVATSQTHEFVVFIVWMPPEQRHLSVQVERRTGVSKLGRQIFGDSPSATGHDEFDHKFKIVSQPPELARRLVGPALIAEHLAGHVPTWSLHNGTLLTYMPGRLQDPTAIPALTAPLARVAALLGR
jgi:hypothetical protein